MLPSGPFDLLSLNEESVGDFKRLTEALRERFSLSKGNHALRFVMRQREQGFAETFEDYADTLRLLANRAYLELSPDLRMLFARDQFMVGIRNEHIQDMLLQSPPATLDDARKTAQQLEAAQAA